jgi:predicted lipid-binding transport protein (Tim44 family)
MDGKIDLITIVSLIVAVVVIFKLRSVLGRRTGDEDTRIERYRAEQQARRERRPEDKVVTLPRREREPAGAVQTETASAAAEAEERIRTFADGNSALEQGLLQILRLDPAFDPNSFIKGAQQAYAMIVTAFAEGNRKLLKDLLSREVYDGFVAAIADRETRGEQIDQSFVGINKAEITEAETVSGNAQVTVRFVSQLISATRDRGGEVISGDPLKIKDVTDIWTFSRDISTARARQNPNWRLIATQASA